MTSIDLIRPPSSSSANTAACPSSFNNAANKVIYPSSLAPSTPLPLLFTHDGQTTRSSSFTLSPTWASLPNTDPPMEYAPDKPSSSKDFSVTIQSTTGLLAKLPKEYQAQLLREIGAVVRRHGQFFEVPRSAEDINADPKGVEGLEQALGKVLRLALGWIDTIASDIGKTARVVFRYSNASIEDSAAYARGTGALAGIIFVCRKVLVGCELRPKQRRRRRLRSRRDVEAGSTADTQGIELTILNGDNDGGSDVDTDEERVSRRASGSQEMISGDEAPE